MAAPAIPPFRLKYPVKTVFRTADGEREEFVSELQLRRPNAKDLMLIDQFGDRSIAMTIHMIAALSGVEVAVSERIDAEDFSALGDMISDFLPGGQTDGETA